LGQPRRPQIRVFGRGAGESQGSGATRGGRREGQVLLLVGRAAPVGVDVDIHIREFVAVIAHHRPPAPPGPDRPAGHRGGGRRDRRGGGLDPAATGERRPEAGFRIGGVRHRITERRGGRRGRRGRGCTGAGGRGCRSSGGTGQCGGQRRYRQL